VNPPTAEDIIAVLDDIEAGRLTVTPVLGPSGQIEFAGDQAYTVSNGWTLVVFIDCGSFDYVSHVTLPNGATVDLWGHIAEWYSGPPHEGDDQDPPSDGYESVRAYRAGREVARDVYGITES
jgi:hypothetical protein